VNAHPRLCVTNTDDKTKQSCNSTENVIKLIYTSIFPNLYYIRCNSSASIYKMFYNFRASM